MTPKTALDTARTTTPVAVRCTAGHPTDLHACRAAELGRHVAIPVAVVVQHTVIFRHQHQHRRSRVTTPQQQKKKCSERAWICLIFTLILVTIVAVSVDTTST